jgi:hypothetical protein
LSDIIWHKLKSQFSAINLTSITHTTPPPQFHDHEKSLNGTFSNRHGTEHRQSAHPPIPIIGTKKTCGQEAREAERQPEDYFLSRLHWLHHLFQKGQ